MAYARLGRFRPGGSAGSALSDATRIVSAPKSGLRADCLVWGSRKLGATRRFLVSRWPSNRRAALRSAVLLALAVCHAATPAADTDRPAKARDDVELALIRLAWASETMGGTFVEERLACAESRLGARWPSTPVGAWVPQQEAAVREAFETCAAWLNAAAGQVTSASGMQDLLNRLSEERGALRLVAEVAALFEQRLRELHAIRAAVRLCETENHQGLSAARATCVRQKLSNAREASAATGAPPLPQLIRTVERRP